MPREGRPLEIGCTCSETAEVTSQFTLDQDEPASLVVRSSLELASLRSQGDFFVVDSRLECLVSPGGIESRASRCE